MAQKWRPHEAARVKSGKYEGLVGTVAETRDETGMVRVLIEGVRAGATLAALVWLKAGQLERPQ